MMRYLAVLALLPLAAGEALAGCAVRRQVKAAVIVEKVAVVAVPVVAVAAIVPAYGAAYVPPAVAPVAATPAVAPAPSPCEKELAALKARLEALEKRGGAVMPRAEETPRAPAAESNPPEPAARALAVFSAKCATCHQRGNEQKGKGLVLLADARTIAPLDLGTQAKVLKKLNKAPGSPGVMPPEDSGIPALKDEEVADIATYIDSLK